MVAQRAKKVVSNNPVRMDFAFGLVNSVFNLPDRQVMIFEEFKLNWRKTVKSILPVKKLLGLVEMMFGLVNPSFSFPEWQAVKMIFFAPCSSSLFIMLVSRKFWVYKNFGLISKSWKHL